MPLVKSRGDLIRMGRIQHHQKQKPTKLYEDFPNILGGHEDSGDNGTESGGEEMMVGKLSLKLLVEPKMSPLSYLLVYYVREDGETVPATHVIQVDKCFANKEILLHWDLLVPQEILVHWDLLVPQEILVHWDRLVPQEILVPQNLLVHWEFLVYLVLLH
uniref:Alpha-2-macroglobulin bait region domain-containing protein n=1 Tax=Timema bartmani TaxID=61472 RepID=A0A7R9FBM0_9NEOP|nr:unnamed protein product [Timema bartmani]